MHPAYLDPLRRIRKLTRAFVEKAIDFEAFYAAFRMNAHQFFDLELDGLPADLKAEVLFYLRWEGFGLYEGYVPVREGWRYGQSNEQYGWIDKVSFVKQFTAEYNSLRRDYDG